MLIFTCPVACAICLDSSITIKELDDDRAGRAFDAEMQVPASPLEVLKVLKNIKEYPEFIESISEVRIINEVNNRALVEERLDLPLGKVKRYRLNILESEFSISWTLQPWPELSPSETIADTTGYWKVSSLNDSNTINNDRNCSLVKYHVYTDPGPVPFGLGWIVDMLTEDSIPDLMDSVRDRVVSFQ